MNNKRINYLTIIIILLLSSPQVFGQEYFIKGSESYINSNYREADSLFTISIDRFESQQAYFNRAISRLELNDFEGGCSDLKIMSDGFYDEESTQLFNLNCCHEIDTVYYNSKFELVESKKYRYYKISKILKYSDDTTATIHKKNAKLFAPVAFIGDMSDFLTATGKTTDIFAKYYLLNEENIYTHIYQQRPVCYSIEEKEKFTKKVYNYLKRKYPQIQAPKEANNISLMVNLIMNPKGEIIEVSDFQFNPNIALGPKTTSFKEDIHEIFINTPRNKPIKFNRKAVYYEFVYRIVF